MTPIRETIARAIYCMLEGEGSDPWGDDEDQLHEECLEDADAVLRALDAAGLAVVVKKGGTDERN